MKLEMNNKLTNKILTAILGAIFLGVGIGMSVKVGIGVDPLSALYTAFANMFSLSVGTITALFNIFMTILAFFLYKKNVGIATVIFIIVSKWPIDFANKYFIHSDNFVVSIILFVFSLIVIALGCELFILSGLGANSYDAVVMGIGKRFNHEIKYVYIRWACDGLCLLLAILLKGEVGVGTVLSFVLLGPFIKKWQTILEKHINN